MKKSTSCPTLLSMNQSTQITQGNNLKSIKVASNRPRTVAVNAYDMVDSDVSVPFFYNAAYNTAVCFSQFDDVKDIAYCIACPPEIIDNDTGVNSKENKSRLSRFEEFYKVFKQNRNRNRKRKKEKEDDEQN